MQLVCRYSWAQRAKMFKYKPESEVTLHMRQMYMHQDPIVYQDGTEWMMPGWRWGAVQAESSCTIASNRLTQE